MIKLKLVLHNIRSTYNVGAILRTAEGLGITEVAYSGYTPRYNDQKLLPHLREKLDNQIAKSALGAEKLVRQTNIDKLSEWLDEQKNSGQVIIGLENNLDEAELDKKILLTKNLEIGKVANEIILVLGEEVHGIPAEIRGKMDYFLEIPMRGQKESFNVSVAAGIAMWGLTAD